MDSSPQKNVPDFILSSFAKRHVVAVVQNTKKKFLLSLFLVGIFTLLGWAWIDILACKETPLKRGGVRFSNLRHPDHAHVFGKSCPCGLNPNKPMQLPISPLLLFFFFLLLRANSIRIGCFAVTAKLGGYLDFRYGKSRWGYLNFFLGKIDNSRAPFSTPILEMPPFNTFISFVRKNHTFDISNREDPPTLDASYTVGNHNYRRYVTLSLLQCACDAIGCFLDSVWASSHLRERAHT